ncbi:ParB/RepB/Spo0J family partition protein [Streptomyces sp. NPDC046631]|uniref:ParB/RepB/Spo0J family partition protein n=1 Tax=unclassified Streptomyces TaxID=2593676 RepID=UPI0033C625B6
MAGRRTSLASLAGAKVDAVPGRSDPLLLTLTLDKIVPTRFNPRRNFGTDEDLKAFGLILKKRQLQPVVVVSRAAYLKLWPDEGERVGSRTYVIANGERRYRASLAAGLPTLNVVHNEDVANTRAEFLDAILSENNDREDLDPIERALGIETMVAELGGADKVAEYYGKTKGWVSQQRKLLKLTPELQALVSSGELPIRIGRDIAGLPAGEQAAAWADETARRQEAKVLPRVRQPAAEHKKVPSPPEPTRFTAVNQNVEPAALPAPTTLAGSSPAPAAPEPELVRAERVPEAPFPEPRHEAGADDSASAAEQHVEPPVRPQVKMPWHDGAAAMQIVFRKLDEEQRRRAIGCYLEMVGGPESAAADLKSAVSPQYREALAKHLSHDA